MLTCTIGLRSRVMWYLSVFETSLILYSLLLLLWVDPLLMVLVWLACGRGLCIDCSV